MRLRPRGRQAIRGNKQVARRQERFFRELPNEQRTDLEFVAREYARAMFFRGRVPALEAKKKDGSRFHVGLNIDTASFSDVARRGVLVSDTLMLSHDYHGDFLNLGSYLSSVDADLDGDVARVHYGMKCPDVQGLGRWILEAEPLMRSGLVWYLPPYANSNVVDPRMGQVVTHYRRLDALDYLVANGRAIDASGATPLKNKVVRPILTMDIPYLEGVSLRDFGKITVEEFNSYEDFRSFLRGALLEMDDALESVQSQVQLAKLESEIRSQVRAVQRRMDQAARTKAMATTGAVLCTGTAALVAVQGEYLTWAVSALGVSAAGIWPAIQSRFENGRRKQRESE
ncbi:hypothetical protein ACLQ2L_21440 [Streptomyces sp. DT203]